MYFVRLGVVTQWVRANPFLGAWCPCVCVMTRVWSMTHDTGCYRGWGQCTIETYPDITRSVSRMVWEQGVFLKGNLVVYSWLLPGVFWFNLQPENSKRCSRLTQFELQPNISLVPSSLPECRVWSMTRVLQRVWPVSGCLQSEFHVTKGQGHPEQWSHTSWSALNNLSTSDPPIFMLIRNVFQ